MSRGGKRKGAGRPPIVGPDSAEVRVKLGPRALAKLDEYAAKHCALRAGRPDRAAGLRSMVLHHGATQ